jgi:4-hydroxy-tetrahydrodipicolinate reductase
MNHTLMVNGLPGKMAEAVIEVALERGYHVIPFSLSGLPEGEHLIKDQSFRLISIAERDLKIKEIRNDHPNLIAVDYTHPTAVNENAEFYIRHKIPFVMGTTGGDRNVLLNRVKSENHYCVIAPNMGKQIIALQTILSQMALNFPNLYEGFTLEVRESHQSTKADTSGTAKAIVSSFQEMGIVFHEDQIQMIRTRDEQLAFKVPENYLDGHAFHTYTLKSPDGTVEFEFKHNVCGRRFYAVGTCDAVDFLSKRIFENSVQFNFDMMDILRKGGM